jgi:hypothetical protein
MNRMCTFWSSTSLVLEGRDIKSVIAVDHIRIGYPDASKVKLSSFISKMKIFANLGIVSWFRTSGPFARSRSSITSLHMFKFTG